MATDTASPKKTKNKKSKVKVKPKPKPKGKSKSKLKEEKNNNLEPSKLQPPRNHYVPQIGDNVVYYTQGHEEYLSKKNVLASPPDLQPGEVFKLPPRPSWLGFESAPAVVECVVSAVNWVFPQNYNKLLKKQLEVSECLVPR